MTFLDRFWSRVRAAGPDECWEWQGARTRGGYGNVKLRSTNEYAHRIASELAEGTPIPAGMQVRHGCDNPPCCNPAHLSRGTAAENLTEAYDRQRRTLRTRQLTDEEATELRRRRQAGEKGRDLAEEYGVLETTVCDIAAGRIYRRAA